MVRRLVAFAVPLFLAACAISPDPAQISDAEFIYRKGDTRLLMVYDLPMEWFATVSDAYLSKRDRKYGEFGGKLRDCSNADYHCLIGGISVAIPKTLSGQQHWEFGGQKCQSERPLTINVPAAITCVSGDWVNQFIYSQLRGITSYSTDTESDVEYRLVDEKGLFAH